MVAIYRRLERIDPRLTTCLLCLVIIAVLELAYPHYFFGDDNMQFTFVHMSEIASNLVHGESMFHHHHIFGGDFDMRDDPAFLSLWNPLTLLCAFLTLTRWKFWAVDVLVSVFLIVAGAVMARLLVRLRNSGYLRLSNTLVAFLSASYACSGYSLIIGEAWGNFAANIASLPLFLIGILHPRAAWGVASVCFAALIGLLAGHLDPLCYSFLFVALFSGFVSWRQKSVRPIAVLSLGVLLSLVIAGPLLWHAWCGFKTNPRAAGLSPEVASCYSTSLLPLVAGYFGGWFAGWAVDPVQIFALPANGSFLLCTSFSSLLIFAVVRRRKRLSIVSHVPLVLALLAILLVERPPILAQAIAQVPVFGSFKWPFRQLMFFHFFIVLWLAFNIGRLPIRQAAVLMFGGLFIFVLSLTQLGRPAFNDFGDRKAILSGHAERFWTGIRREMPPDSVFVAVVGSPNAFWQWKYPLCLAGANDFPALYGVTMAGGYSFSKPCNSERTKIPCDPFLAFFDYQTIPALLKIYKKLYIMEIASPESVRVGTLDAGGWSGSRPRLISVATASDTPGRTPDVTPGLR
jgi:hypothetical protein